MLICKVLQTNPENITHPHTQTNRTVQAQIPNQFWPGSSSLVNSFSSRKKRIAPSFLWDPSHLAGQNSQSDAATDGFAKSVKPTFKFPDKKAQKLLCVLFLLFPKTICSLFQPTQPTTCKNKQPNRTRQNPSYIKPKPNNQAPHPSHSNLRSDMDNLLPPPGAKRIFGCFTQVFQPSDCCPSAQITREKLQSRAKAQVKQGVANALPVCLSLPARAKARQARKAKRNAVKSSSQDVNKSCLNPW